MYKGIKRQKWQIDNICHFFLQFYDSYDKIQVLTLFWHLVYTYKVLIGDK